MVSGRLYSYRALPVGSQRQSVAKYPCSCGSVGGIYSYSHLSLPISETVIVFGAKMKVDVLLILQGRYPVFTALNKLIFQHIQSFVIGDDLDTVFAAPLINFLATCLTFFAHRVSHQNSDTVSVSEVNLVAIRKGFAGMPVLLGNSFAYSFSIVSHGISSAFFIYRLFGFIFNPSGWLNSVNDICVSLSNLYIVIPPRCKVFL